MKGYVCLSRLPQEDFSLRAVRHFLRFLSEAFTFIGKTIREGQHMLKATALRLGSMTKPAPDKETLKDLGGFRRSNNQPK
jgi:hypothetical protein